MKWYLLFLYQPKKQIYAKLDFFISQLVSSKQRFFQITVISFLVTLFLHLHSRNWNCLEQHTMVFLNQKHFLFKIYYKHCMFYLLNLFSLISFAGDVYKHNFSRTAFFCKRENCTQINTNTNV